MARPRKNRAISSRPGADYFKPRGVPISRLEVTALTMAEYEAMRLYDVEGLDQATAAGMMNVSRTTFGRIVTAAHRKVAAALYHGQAIRIGGEEERP
jgi:predicted DNA-binding protein (UPF0251 family)